MAVSRRVLTGGGILRKAERKNLTPKFVFDNRDSGGLRCKVMKKN